jgi:hypothetical protein
MALTLRLTKGSPLTHTELDDNFSHLQGLINSLNTGTGSLLYSGSFDESSSTLTLYSDNQTYEVDLSALVDVTDTGSFYISSSVNLNTITFTQGDGTTESVTVSSLYTADGNLTDTRTVTADGSSLTFEFETAPFIINSDPSQRVVIANLPTEDQPQVVGIDSSGNLKAMNTSSIAGTSTDISALNTFTGSIQIEVDNLTAATSSYLTNDDTGSFYISSGVNLNTITFTQGDGTTESVTVDTGSDTNIANTNLTLDDDRTLNFDGNSLKFNAYQGEVFEISSSNTSEVIISDLPNSSQPQVIGYSSTGRLTAMNTSSFGGSTDTGSFYISSGVNLNTITFTQGDGTTESVTVDTGSVGTLQTVTDNGNTTTNDVEISGSLDVTGSLSMIGQSTFTSLNNLSSPVVIEPGVGSPYGSLYMKTYATAGTIAEFNQSVISINSSYTLGSLKFSKQTSTWGLIKAQATNTNQKSVISLTANGTSTPHIEIDGENDEITINNTVLAPDLANTSKPNVVGYDTATGELTYYSTGSFGGTVNTGSFVYSGSFDGASSVVTLYSKDLNYDLDLSGLAGGGGGFPITASDGVTDLTNSMSKINFVGNAVEATNVGSIVTVTVNTGSAPTPTDITALNNFTGSIQTEVDSLTAATSSYLTGADTGSFVYSGSFDGVSSVVTLYSKDLNYDLDLSGLAGDLQQVTDNGDKTTNGIDIAKLFISGSDTTSLVVDVKNSDLSSSFQIYNNGAVAAYGKGGTPSNVALGLGALGTVGTNNTTLIGGFAGANNTGTLSTIIGGYAGNSNTANSATILGYQAGWYNTGAESVLVGSYAGKLNSGGSVTFIGTAAGQLNTGNSNTGVGYLALFSGSGRDNTALGTLAGYETGDLTGNNNTFLGYNASYGVNTSITNATAVGANVTLAESNTVILGNNASVGIGTPTPGATLHTTGSISGSGDVYFDALSNTTTPNIVGYDTATGQLSYYSTGSFGSGGGSTDTGSFYISSSIANNIITFNQGDGTTESVTVSNLYTADGNLTGDRTVTADGSSLTFQFETAPFIINSDPGREVQINNLPTEDTSQVVGYAGGVLKAMPTSSFKPKGPLNTFQFNKNNAFSGSSLFFDSATERVGIGESSPLYPLHITDTRPIGIRLERTDDPIVGIQFFGSGASGGGLVIRGLANDFEIIQRDTVTSQNERNLFISESGEVYIPRIDQSTTVSLLGYDTATGEVTYQRSTSDGGGRLNNFAVPTGSLHYTTNTVATAATSSFVTIAGTVNTGDGLNSHNSREYPALVGKTLGTDAFVTATWKDYAEGSISSQYIVVQSITAQGALTIRTADVVSGTNDAIMFTAMILI